MKAHANEYRRVLAEKYANAVVSDVVLYRGLRTSCDNVREKKRFIFDILTNGLFSPAVFWFVKNRRLVKQNLLDITRFDPKMHAGVCPSVRSTPETISTSYDFPNSASKSERKLDANGESKFLYTDKENGVVFKIRIPPKTREAFDIEKLMGLRDDYEVVLIHEIPAEYIEGVYIVRPRVADQSKHYVKFVYQSGCIEIISSEELECSFEEVSRNLSYKGRCLKHLAFVDNHVYLSKQIFCSRYENSQSMIMESLDDF
ncbi:MAG: hypothetical protein AB8G05_09445 [Oligoflexales bacterium]